MFGLLKSELFRPLDAFGPSLTQAAHRGVVEVTPNVNARLPIETVNRRTRRGARSGGDRSDRRRLERPWTIPGGRGTLSARPPTSFSARRIEPDRTAGRLLQLRATCPLREAPPPAPVCHCRFRRSSPSGMACNSAMSCAFRAFLQVRHTWAGHSRSSSTSEGINDGYVLMAPSEEVAASMLGAPGYATAALVLCETGR